MLIDLPDGCVKRGAVVLLQPGASAGLSFVTDGLCSAYPANSHTFPNDKGFHAGVNHASRDVYEFADSDVVCLESCVLSGSAG